MPRSFFHLPNMYANIFTTFFFFFLPTNRCDIRKCQREYVSSNRFYFFSFIKPFGQFLISCVYPAIDGLYSLSAISLSLSFSLYFVFLNPCRFHPPFFCVCVFPVLLYPFFILGERGKKEKSTSKFLRVKLE